MNPTQPPRAQSAFERLQADQKQQMQQREALLASPHAILQTYQQPTNNPQNVPQSSDPNQSTFSDNTSTTQNYSLAKSTSNALPPVEIRRSAFDSIQTAPAPTFPVNIAHSNPTPSNLHCSSDITPSPSRDQITATPIDRTSTQPPQLSFPTQLPGTVNPRTLFNIKNEDYISTLSINTNMDPDLPSFDHAFDDDDHIVSLNLDNHRDFHDNGDESESDFESHGSLLGLDGKNKGKQFDTDVIGKQNRKNDEKSLYTNSISRHGELFPDDACDLSNQHQFLTKKNLSFIFRIFAVIIILLLLVSVIMHKNRFSTPEKPDHFSKIAVEIPNTDNNTQSNNNNNMPITPNESITKSTPPDSPHAPSTNS